MGAEAGGARIVPVVLCGGAGTRLWPLSRRDLPKQFLALAGGGPLLAQTLERAAGIATAEALVVTGADHQYLVREAANDAGLAARVVVEPAGRNTAPALCLAALAALDGESVTPDPILVCMPSDHYMPDADAFTAAIGLAAGAAAAGYWVTLGIVPRRPSPAYGYVAPGAPLAGHDGVMLVDRFVEKPDAEKAAVMVGSGAYWNAGIFIVRADVLMNSIDAHAGDIGVDCRAAMAGARTHEGLVRIPADRFADVRSISIDHAVMEHEKQVAVVPYASAWNDIGSWTALDDINIADASGNRIDGEGLTTGCANVSIYSPHRLAAAVGVSDLVIADTPDALLVAAKGRAEDVRDIVATLDRTGRSEARSNSFEMRPWGSFRSLERGPGFQVKRLTVKPGGVLSLQYHHQRDEHWVVVSGIATVQIGEREFELAENEGTFITAKTAHRLSNRGTDNLEVIEVQYGSYLGEDDIVRLDDTYGRTNTDAADASPDTGAGQ